MTERRFVLVDFRYSNDAMGYVRLYEAGLTYDMRPALAHAAPRRQFVAKRRPAAVVYQDVRVGAGGECCGASGFG